MADGQAILEPLVDDFDADAGQGGADEQTHTETQQQEAGAASGEQNQDQSQSQTQGEDGPYSAKTSKEFSNALKEWRDSGPKGAKWARMAKDDHSRLFQLHQLEPDDIDGVMAKYARLDAVTYGDLKGLDAVTSMQDMIQSYADVDGKLAAGDPSFLDDLGDDFNEGIAKIVPAILSRVAASNPEAYAAAILPHFVEQLKSSDLVKNYNALVDTLNEAPPTWLTADQKGQWTNDRLQRVLAHAGGMGEWLNAQAQKAKGVTPANATGTQQGKTVSPLDQREQAIVQREQAEYWNNSVAPETNKIAERTFTELFKPYEKRLKLDTASMSALAKDFVAGVTKKATARKADGSPSDYVKQMDRYHKTKNPNAASVSNFFSVEFRKHAPHVFKALVDERYGAFLKAAPNSQVQSKGKPNGSANPGASKQMQYVSVKPDPSTYDNTKRSVNDIYSDIYRLNDGRVVKFKRVS